MELVINDWRATCEEVARYAQCTRRQVGAILVKAGAVVGWGANRSADTELSCLDGECPRGRLSYEEHAAYAPYGNCIAKHAEIYALEMAGALFANGSVLYITDEPCADCSKALRAAGVHTWRIYPRRDDALLQTLPAAEARASGRLF